MKTTHTVTFRGQTFKRVSKSRKYSHAVLVVESLQHSLEATKRARFVQEWAVKSLTERLANGETENVFVAGWCSRLDLAQKHAARWNRPPRYVAHILEVQQS